MDFRVGQKVVCIDASPSHWPHELRVNQIYTIGSIVSMCGVHLVEELHSNPSGFLATRFRPVVEKKTDISIFTEMLKPKQRELISP